MIGTYRYSLIKIYYTANFEKALLKQMFIDYRYNPPQY